MPTPDGSATPPGRPHAPARVPDAVVLTIDRPIAAADVAALWQRVQRAVEDRGSDLLVCDVSAIGRADVGAVGALARLALIAGRNHCRVELGQVPAGLRALLTLTGLDEFLPCAAGSGIESRR